MAGRSVKITKKRHKKCISSEPGAPAARGARQEPIYAALLLHSPHDKDGSEVTEIPNAAHSLMAAATLTPRTPRRRSYGVLDACEASIAARDREAACHLRLRGTRGRMRSAGPAEATGRHKGSTSARSQVPSGARGRATASTAHHCGCVRPVGTFPNSA